MTDAELQLAEARLREMLGPRIMKLAESCGLDLGESLRLSVLTGQLASARERRGLTLKEGAARLRVPQHRLREVESGSRLLQPDLLARYVEFLGLESVAFGWAARYPQLASKFGLTPRGETEARVQRVRRARRPGST